MPYITEERKAELRNERAHLDEPKNAGELNYWFTQAAIDYIKMWGLSYTRINDVIGALEGAKLEFYRRVAGPYEAKKVKENGDVYPPEWTGYEVNW